MHFAKDSLAALVLLAAALGAAMLFVYVPQDKKLGQLQAKIVTRKRQIDEQTERASIVPKLLRETQAMKAQYKNFHRRLPQQKELGGFLREISGHLADDKFSDQITEPGRPTREPLFNTLPIIMKFKGSYLGLGVFLDQINKMERLTRVQRLIITSPPPDGETPSEGRKKEPGLAKGNLDIELQLNIYFSANERNERG